MDRTKTIMEAAESGDNMRRAKATIEVLNDILRNIGEVISPMNDIVAPFVLVALQKYIDEIGNYYPVALKITKSIQNVLNDVAATAVFKIPIKEDKNESTD